MTRWKSLIIAVGVILLSLPAQAGTIYTTLGLVGSAWEPWTVLWVFGGASTIYIPTAAHAWSFVAPATVTADGVDVTLARMPALPVVYPENVFPGNSVTMEICADSGGVPGSVLRSVTVVDALPTFTPYMPFNWTSHFFQQAAIPALIRFAFGSTLNLSSGTTYWIVMRASTSPNTLVWWSVACQVQAVPGVGKWQNSGGSWAALPIVLSQTRDNAHENCAYAFRVTSPDGA